MYRLVADTEVETETEQEVDKEKVVEDTTEEPPTQTEYLKSFENLTLADVKKEQEKKSLVEFEKEKEELIQKQYVQEEKVVEKPNYDLITENKKIIKLKKKIKPKSEKVAKKSKKAGIILAIALGLCSIVAVTNITILDNFSTNLSQLETEFYEVNLPKYLKKISDLDTTKKSMEFLETYPEEMLSAGDIGEETNWFNKFCNWLGGLFGG